MFIWEHMHVHENILENRILGIKRSRWLGSISLFGAMVTRVVDVVILVIVWVTNDNSLCHSWMQHFIFQIRAATEFSIINISEKENIFVLQGEILGWQCNRRGRPPPKPELKPKKAKEAREEWSLVLRRIVFFGFLKGDTFPPDHPVIEVSHSLSPVVQKIYWKQLARLCLGSFSQFVEWWCF